MSLALISSSVTAFQGLQAAAVPARSSGVRMAEDLPALAKSLNPVVGFWDPLRLSKSELWNNDNDFSVGWLREAEVKHGRVAMAGFVGYIVHANDIRFPWAPVGGEAIPTGLSPPELWDAIPFAAKVQIILTIGIFEFWRENAYVLEADGQKHYCKGGKVGYFPTWKELPHEMPFPLFDPFGFSKGRSEEDKAKGRLIEINNGRLAQLGLFGFFAESKVPGSVPALSGIVKPYAGEYMAPFTCVGADCAAGGIDPASLGF